MQHFQKSWHPKSKLRIEFNLITSQPLDFNSFEFEKCSRDNRFAYEILEETEGETIMIAENNELSFKMDHKEPIRIFHDFENSYLHEEINMNAGCSRPKSKFIKNNNQCKPFEPTATEKYYQNFHMAKNSKGQLDPSKVWALLLIQMLHMIAHATYDIPTYDGTWYNCNEHLIRPVKHYLVIGTDLMEGRDYNFTILVVISKDKSLVNVKHMVIEWIAKNEKDQISEKDFELHKNHGRPPNPGLFLIFQFKKMAKFILIFNRLKTYKVTTTVSSIANCAILKMIKKSERNLK